MGSRKIYTMIFFLVILLGQYVPLSEATSEESVYYSITIDNTEGVITVEVYFSDVDDPQITLILPSTNYFESRGVPLTITLLDTNGNVLETNKYEWTLRPSGGSIHLKYKIEGYTIERISKVPWSMDIKYSGIGNTMAAIIIGTVLAVPYDKSSYSFMDKYLMKPAIVKFNIPDNWEIFAPFHVDSSNTIKTNMVYDILRSFIEMGEVSIKYSGKYYGINTNYVLFKRPDIPRNSPARISQVPFLHSGMDRKKEAERLMKDTAYYFYELSRIFNYTPAEEITIASEANIWPYWRGWWQIDDGFRQDQIAHHVVHHWFSSVVSISGVLNNRYWKFYEGPALYYAPKLAYNHTQDRRYLGEYYAMYLIYKRGIKERLVSENDPLSNKITTYGPLLSYGYSPLLIWYFDEEIRRQTNNRSNIDTVFRYLLRSPYRDINVDEFISSIKESTGVDFSDFYYNHALVDFSIPLDSYAEKYKDDFVYLLDFQRRNNEAPDILYYVVMEMESKHGHPDAVLILPQSYLKGDFLVTGQQYRSFINELINNYPLTEAEFIKILNKYTDGKSSDFFEFYTKYGPRPPTIESLNLWISGEYSRLIRKSVYLNTLITRLSKVVPKDSEYYDLLVTANTSYSRGMELLNIDRFDEANAEFDRGIGALDELYTLDLDNDGVEDISELFLGLSTTSYDSNSDGIPDKYEVIKKFQLDGVGEEWEEHEIPETLGVTWGSREYVRNVRLYKDDTYLYGKIELSKPAYAIERYAIVFRLDFDGNWDTFDDTVAFPLFTEFSFWGSEFNYGGSYFPFGCMNEYEIIHDNTIEFKIPLKTIREYYDYFSSYISSIPQNIPASIVFVKLDRYLNVDWGKTAGIDFSVNLDRLSERSIIRSAEIIYGEGRVDGEYSRGLSRYILNPNVKTDSIGGREKYLILVGGPLANQLTKKYMGYFSVQVTNSFPGRGKGVIEVAKINGRVIVLLAGSDRWGTKAAVEVFKKLSYIPSKPIFVSWNNGQPKIIEGNIEG